MSRRSRWFLGLVVFVASLAVVFSEGLMAVAKRSGDDEWATHLVDNAVQGNNTGVSRIYRLSI